MIGKHFISWLPVFSLAMMVSAAEPEVVKLKPDTGVLKVAKIEQNGKPTFLETVFPIKSTDNKSFTATITIEVTKWRSTGIHIGFKNSKNERMYEVWLLDDHMGHGSANMNVFLADEWGFNFQSAFCQMPFTTRSILVELKYEAPLGRFKAMVCDSNDRKRVFGESEWKEVKGYFTIDQFFARAITLTKDQEKEKAKEKRIPQPGSSVKWDQSSNGIRVFSQVGNEDIMEALIKNVTIQTEE